MVALFGKRTCSSQYAEDAIFNITQAWELLSDEWEDETSELPESLKELKGILKGAIKAWKNTSDLNKSEVNNGFITGRVIKALEWKKLIDRLFSLAKSERLNLEKIGLNFKLLKECRDSIAHTGKFKNNIQLLEVHNTLDASIFGLQILILRKLNYRGNIINNSFGVKKKVENIEYFLS